MGEVIGTKFPLFSRRVTKHVTAVMVRPVWGALGRRGSTGKGAACSQWVLGSPQRLMGPQELQAAGATGNVEGGEARQAGDPDIMTASW